MAQKAAQGEVQPLLAGQRGPDYATQDAVDEPKKKHFNMVGLSPSAFWGLVGPSMGNRVGADPLPDALHILWYPHCDDRQLHRDDATERDLVRVLRCQSSTVVGHQLVSPI